MTPDTVGVFTILVGFEGERQRLRERESEMDGSKLVWQGEGGVPVAFITISSEPAGIVSVPAGSCLQQGPLSWICTFTLLILGEFILSNVWAFVHFE